MGIKNLRVLLVEDLASDVKFINEIIKDIPNISFKIKSAKTLKDAINFLKESFDIILLDLNLPDSKGLDTFKAINDKANDTPLIILTVIEDRSLMIDAVRTGAQDYLIKRFITADNLERAMLYGIERNIARYNLLKALNDLKISNDELQNFSYMMSHDLQDPLKTISNFLGLIKKRYSEKFDKDGKEFINITINASNRMQNLINDLLTYSRISTTKEMPKNADLNKVFDEAVKNLNAENKNISHDKLPIIKGVYYQLVIIFQNLISNALKFAKKKPSIHIGYLKKNYKHVLSFKDNGIGIKKEDYEKVFKVFEKLNPTSEYDGSGLGLAIVKKLVEFNHGKIWVESELGKGSTFYISLPSE
ncbi:MAG: ATP-binding protein [Patescibacteria group bacterium]|nr:ATP-binding protein [Patescibacteria group bacterium]